MNIDQQNAYERFIADYKAGKATFEETVLHLLTLVWSELEELREQVEEPRAPEDPTW